MKKLNMSVMVLLAMLFLLLQGCSQPAGPGSVTNNDGNYIPTAETGFKEVTNFGTNPANLKMYQYVPAGMSTTEPAPLIVVFHGCSQNATGYSTDSGWKELAEKFKFYVVFPEQNKTESSATKTGNQYGCFNWAGYYGDMDDLVRGKRGNQSVIEMVNYIKDRYPVNNNKVFVTGLSAGAAMANVMLATWPDVFAAGAPMAGIPYYCATSVDSAYGCMGINSSFQPRTGTGCESMEACMDPALKKTAPQWGDMVRTKGFPAGYTGRLPRVMVWQGFKDQYVDDDNQAEIVKQWTNVHGIDQTPDFTGTLKSSNKHAYKEYKDANGKVLVATIEIPDMKHAISVDPGTGEDQGGKVNSNMLSGGYSTDHDIFSSYYAYKFFMDATENQDNPPTVDIVSPAGSSTPGNLIFKVNASDDNGVAKVEFFINGALVASKTSAPYEYTWAATDGNYTLKAVATDTAGQVTAVEKAVVIGQVIDNPPVVSISSPANGATLIVGTTSITANASDDKGVAKVDFYVNNNLVATDSAAPYSYSWTPAAGSYTIKAMATDTAGQTATSAQISVTVQPSSGETYPVLDMQKLTGNYNGLNMYLNVPAGIDKSLPTSLVVVLHGCQQSASSFKTETEFHKIGAKEKFITLFPEEPSHIQKCFDWWTSTSINGGGDTGAIKAAIDSLKNGTYKNINKVYVFGFSAGAGMALQLAALYPELVTKVAVSAAVPYKGYIGSDASSLNYIMNMDGAAVRTPSTLAALMPKNPGTYPPLIHFHGTSDGTVKYAKFFPEILNQWTAANGIDQTADETTTMEGQEHKKYKDASGNVIVETVSITGLGHAVSVDPGTGEKQGGTTAQYAVDKNLYVPYYAWQFFSNGVVEPIDMVPSVSITSPADGAAVSGTVTISANASDDKGVTKVSFYIDNNFVAEDTTAPYSYSWNLANYTNGTHSVKAVATDTIGQTAEALISVTGGEKQDTTKPTVNVTAPVSGQALTGTSVALKANAFDDTGVTKVEFFVDNVKVGEDTSSPYELTVTVGEGTHSVKAIAYDAAGNFSIDDDTSFSVQGFVCQEFTATNYAHKAAGRAESHYPLTQYIEYVKTIGKGDDLGQVGTQYYSTTNTIAETAPGYFIKGTCPAGEDKIAPSVAITSPANNATVSGSVSISADASDNVGVTKVEFFVDGTKIGEKTAAPFTVSWASTSGTHSITAKASDAAGNVTVSAAVSLTVEGGSFVCKTFTATNAQHVEALRAEVYVQWYTNYVKTIGSGESLGMLGSSWYSATSTVRETAPGYFEKGSCQ
ncbi:hypothetical protein CVU75_02395 [Candidatus Dependentiae bacterium HGW-Dependentiae-1]|nr:MAG: hypothetical protein CVU75_02395 [Candidatus Dependentiae bacterium HGW-Dependentiae-1]